MGGEVEWSYVRTAAQWTEARHAKRVVRTTRQMGTYFSGVSIKEVLAGGVSDEGGRVV